MQRSRTQIRAEALDENPGYSACRLCTGIQSGTILDVRRTAGEACENAGVEKLSGPLNREPLLFLFLHIPTRRFRLLDNLLLQCSRYGVVVVHLHIEGSTALGHRS